MDQQGESVRKLYRSRKERVIGGVCGGVAEYFRIDPVWVRIVWVLAIFVKGLGLVAYALCWILIPEREWSPGEAQAAQDPGTKEKPAGEGAADAASQEANSSSFLSLPDSQPRTVIGIVLIVLGCIFGAVAFVPFLNEHAFWALVLIVLGIVLIAKR